MFGMLKWLTLIFIVCAVWYLANFFMSMEQEEFLQVKKDAIAAIELGDVNQLVSPLAHKIKEDLGHKKANLLEIVRHKLKRVVDRID